MITLASLKPKKIIAASPIQQDANTGRDRSNFSFGSSGNNTTNQNYGPQSQFNFHKKSNIENYSAIQSPTNFKLNQAISPFCLKNNNSAIISSHETTKQLFVKKHRKISSLIQAQSQNYFIQSNNQDAQRRKSDLPSYSSQYSPGFSNVFQQEQSTMPLQNINFNYLSGFNSTFKSNKNRPQAFKLSKLNQNRQTKNQSMHNLITPSKLQQRRKCPSWLLKKKEEITLADFSILKDLGEGKYAKVCLCQHRKTKMIMAMKILDKQQIKKEQMENVVANELKICLFLKHPNITQIYGCFYDSQKIYILMEYAGINLHSSILKDSDDVVQNLINIYEAVAYLHCLGILHRDIKPQNILCNFGVSKLCDFGWAVFTQGTSRTTFCGSPLYVSPQILKGQFYDEKTDVWGLGVLTYELIYGKVPFQMSKPDDIVKILSQQIKFPLIKNYSQFLPTLQNMLHRDSRKRPTLNQIMTSPFFQEHLEVQRQSLIYD